jgi:N utilization substance protein A
MNDELFDALVILEKEKNIKSEVLLEAIAKSLEQACRNNFNRPELDNIVVDLNQEKRSFGIFLAKEVVETVEDKLKQISLADARMINSKYEVGDVVNVDINSRAFGRIAVQNAKNVILQQIREAERKSLFADYYDKENKVVTGVVQRYVNRNVAINLGKVDAILSESEMIKGETFYPNQRVKVYVLRVDNAPKGPRIVVSRKHPNLVRCLFEQEVAEVADGTVEIKAIAREAGSRSKMAVWSNIPNVDAVGACVGQNGNRVAAVVDELDGEKIDIVSWDENPAYFIENALSPAKVITVIVDPDERTARVVVPDYQLSLAIGKEGQNARLTARLTGYKIDIKSETQAIESGELQEFQDEYYDYEDEYDENGEPYPDEYYEDYPEDSYYEDYSGTETDPSLE